MKSKKEELDSWREMLAGMGISPGDEKIRETIQFIAEFLK